MTQLVYVGRRLCAGKLCHGFAPLELLDQPSYFALKGKTGYVVGSIYEAEAQLLDEQGQLASLTPGTLTWTRQMVDETVRAAWELADRQAYRGEATRLAAARVMRTAKSYAEAERVAAAIKVELLDGWSR